MPVILILMLVVLFITLKWVLIHLGIGAVIAKAGLAFKVHHIPQAIFYGIVSARILYWFLGLADVLTNGNTETARGWLAGFGLFNIVSVSTLVTALLWAGGLKRRYRLPILWAASPAIVLIAVFLLPAFTDPHYFWISYTLLALFWIAWWTEHVLILYRMWMRFREWSHRTKQKVVRWVRMRITNFLSPNKDPRT